MANIYETIWNSPASHVSVSRRGEDGEWINPGADILLDEQSRASGCTSQDASARTLFARVNEAIFDEPTFRTFIALLNNYTAQAGRRERELSDPDLAAEIDAFLDAALATEPMRLALEHVQNELEPPLTEPQFRDRVRQMWFEPFENNFSGRDPFCVGFEHVFVGEDETTPDRPPRHCADSVGGYHSWVKFYLDQKAGKVAYLGHDYESRVAELGLADPHVATVLMTWEPSDADGGAGHELLKKPGGFFVGTRPECEIAIGAVGLLELEGGRFQQPGNQEDHRRVRLGDSFFDLVLHPHTVQRTPRRNGPHIRTLYPKFRGNEALDGGGGGGGGTGLVPTQPHNDGAIRLVRALPNPPGPEDRGEWVELRNATTAAIDLAPWRLMDAEGRPQALSRSLLVGETRRVEITRENQGSMQLRNSGGWILLFEGTQRRAAVRYGQAGQGKIVVFN